MTLADAGIDQQSVKAITDYSRVINLNYCDFGRGATRFVAALLDGGEHADSVALRLAAEYVRELLRRELLASESETPR